MKHCFLFKPAVLLLVAALFTLGACNDPIFYTIAQEVAPIEPRIKGGPTNFVVFNDVLYVASGNTIHWYKNGEWDSIGQVPQPRGRINFLAVAGGYLYALCYLQDNKDTSVIMRLNSGGTDWNPLTNTTGYHVMSIYAPDPNSPYVFIGAEIDDSFAVLYADGLSINIIPGISGAAEFELCGAAFDGIDYYLCTKGGGIYHVTAGLVPTLISGTENIKFTGIISLGSSYIAAIDRAGKLYTVDSSGIVDTTISIDGDYLSTGMLAIWEDPLKPGSRMLLAGRQYSVFLTSSAYTNGYVELELDLNGIPISAFREPGISPPSSVVDGDNERYKSTIGRLAINYMFQAPREVDPGDSGRPGMRLFASTQNEGVWSYRIRNGIYQWNAED